MSNTEIVTVCKTIMDQIGPMPLMSIGAREYLVSGEECGRLTMRVGGGRRLRKLSVTLTGRDDYTVRYAEYTLRGFRLIQSGILDGVYCDMLAKVVLKMGEGRVDGYDNDPDADLTTSRGPAARFSAAVS